MAKLSWLRVLTSGDFAAAARKNQFRPISSVAALVEALEAECVR
jgi:hypothetical protein